MKGKRDTPRNNLTPAVEAIANLLLRELNEIHSSGQIAGLIAHTEIEVAPITQKSGAFYRNFVPLRTNLVSLLAGSYRRYFKLALAHPRETGSNPDQWAWGQLQPAVGVALEWIPDWYILACDGENQYLQKVASLPFVPGETVSTPLPLTATPSLSAKSWRAPAWLFAISLALVGVGPLKDKHVPARDSEQRLGAAHTRLLLKGARRVFLWELAAAIERVRDEETAAAGAVPMLTTDTKPPEVAEPKKPKHWLKGFEGLPHKEIDLSRYMDNLTERQRMAYSLRKEYRLRLSEVADRMGVNRKTAYEYIESADLKIQQAYSNEKRKSRRDPNSSPEA